MFFVFCTFSWIFKHRNLFLCILVSVFTHVFVAAYVGLNRRVSKRWNPDIHPTTNLWYIGVSLGVCHLRPCSDWLTCLLALLTLWKVCLWQLQKTFFGSYHQLDSLVDTGLLYCSCAPSLHVCFFKARIRFQNIVPVFLQHIKISVISVHCNDILFLSES